MCECLTNEPICVQNQSDSEIGVQTRAFMKKTQCKSVIGHFQTGVFEIYLDKMCLSITISYFWYNFYIVPKSISFVGQSLLSQRFDTDEWIKPGCRSCKQQHTV